ncbi:MAG: NAD(P)H-dependent oxidoreductase [Pseudomonadota bacterium]|nr:NAD(P)H-dependent oxidoreductase [Pseudomonadota bacterium]
MVKILVVLANPKVRCFTREACATFCEEARARGHEVELRDLYAMNFNPVASEADLRGNLTGDVAPDVAEEQALVRWAEVIAFVHPVWWIDRPAILKGYVDRVFALGFAYGYAANGEVGSLAGRKAALITCSGSPAENFATTGKAEAMRIAQDVYTMEFCGLEMLGHLHFAPVGRRSTPEMIEDFLDTVRTFVRTRL